MQSTKTKRQGQRIQGGWASDGPRSSGSAGLGRGRGKERCNYPTAPPSNRQNPYPSDFHQQQGQPQQKQQQQQPPSQQQQQQQQQQQSQQQPQLQQQQQQQQSQQQPQQLQQQLRNVGLGRGRGKQRCSSTASPSNRGGPSSDFHQQQQKQQQLGSDEGYGRGQSKEGYHPTAPPSNRQGPPNDVQQQQQLGSGGFSTGQGKERSRQTGQPRNRQGPPSDVRQQQQLGSGGFSRGHGKERSRQTGPSRNRQGPPSDFHQRFKNAPKKKLSWSQQAGPVNRAPCGSCGGPNMGPDVGCLCPPQPLDMSYRPSGVHQFSFGQPQDLCSAMTFVQPEEPVMKETVKPIVLKESCKKVISTEPSGESQVELMINFLDQVEAKEAFRLLDEEVKWKQQINKNRTGDEYEEPRLVSWYGEHPYAYSKVKMEANSEWPPTLMKLKMKIEEATKLTFNSVLANKYRNEKDGVAWHSDDEYGLRDQPKIASLSLGETRMFEMRKKPPKECDAWNYDYTESEKYKIPLTSGCLLLMTGHTQDDWQHRVPKEYHDKKTRINLTFRNIYPDDRHERDGYTSYQLDG